MNEEAKARSKALALLASLHVCNLATYGDGEAHAVSLLYAHHGLLLYWLSDPATHHSRYIEAAPAAPVAMAIAADQTDFRTIRGVQMHGLVRRLSAPEEREAAMQLLSRRYRYLDAANRPPEVAAALRKAMLYCFAPTRVTVIDNTAGLGARVTFTPTADDDDLSPLPGGKADTNPAC